MADQNATTLQSLIGSEIPHLIGSSEQASLIEAFWLLRKKGLLSPPEEKKFINNFLEGNYPEMQSVLQQSRDRIAHDLENTPPQVLQEDFSLNRPTQQQIRTVLETQKKIPTILEEIKQATGLTQEEFSKKLVDQYLLSSRKAMEQTEKERVAAAFVGRLRNQAMDLQSLSEKERVVATQLQLDPKINELIAAYHETEKQFAHDIAGLAFDSPGPVSYPAYQRALQKNTSKKILPDSESRQQAHDFAMNLSQASAATETPINDFSEYYRLTSKGKSLPFRLFAQAADAITNLSPETKEARIASQFARELQKNGESASFANRIIGPFVTSDTFRRAIQNGQQTFGQGEQGAKTSSSFVMDVISTVLHPNTEPYVQLATIQGAHAPNSMGALYAALLAYSGGQEALLWTTSNLGKMGSSRLGGFFENTFNKIDFSAINPGGLLARAVGGLMGGTSPNGLLRFLTRPVTAVAWYKNGAILAALGVILIITVPLLFPSALTGGPVYNQAVINTALVTNGGDGATEEFGSKYIRVTKTPTTPKLGNNFSGDVSFTISIIATTLPLTNVRVVDTAMLYGTGKQTTLSFPTIDVPKTIEPGASFTKTVTVNVSQKTSDSLILNTIDITADAGENIGETKSASGIVTIGTPPTWCFTPTDSGSRDSCGSGVSPTPWGSDWAGVLPAIMELSKSPTYMAKICKAGPIPVWRVRTNFGGGCYSNGGIYLYDYGVRGGSAIYTFAHETGHVLNARSGLFNTFYSNGVPAREGLLPTYPNAKSYTEDFAETIGMYVGHSFYYPAKWSAYPKYPESYPLHYQFAKELFGNVEY